MAYLYVIIAICNNVLSQLLVKKGSMSVVSGEGVLRTATSMFNVYLLIGGVLNFLTPIFVILAYRDLDLSFVYSLTSLNYVFVTLGAKVFFKEQLNIFSYIGILLITLGLLIYNL